MPPNQENSVSVNDNDCTWFEFLKPIVTFTDVGVMESGNKLTWQKFLPHEFGHAFEMIALMFHFIWHLKLIHAVEMVGEKVEEIYQLFNEKH